MYTMSRRRGAGDLHMPSLSGTAPGGTWERGSHARRAAVGGAGDGAAEGAVSPTERSPATVDGGCPMLLRVFIGDGAPHALSDFATDRVSSDDEVAVHVTTENTLQEVLELASMHNALLRRRGVRLDCAFIASGHDGRLVARPVGRVSLTGQSSKSAKQTLQELKVHPGDMLDVAALQPIR